MMGFGMWGGGYWSMILGWLIIAGLAVWVLSLLFRANQAATYREYGEWPERPRAKRKRARYDGEVEEYAEEEYERRWDNQ